MVVTIKVPEEIEAEARARGITVEVYVQEIFAQRVLQSSESQQRRSPEQIRSWLDSMAQFSDKIPALPETISRQWIYRDHD